MSVDDVAVFSFHSEFIQNHVADIFTVAQGVIIAFHFFVRFLVGQEITLEGSHLTLIEGRRVLSAPQIPDKVSGKCFFRIIFFCKISCTDELAYALEQGFSLVFLSEYVYFLKRSVGIHRHRSMEEQVRVAYIVHASVTENAFHVLAQFLASRERFVQFLYDFFFFFCQLVWVFRIDGLEQAVAHLIIFSVKLEYFPLEVDVVQQQTAVHVEFRMTPDGSSFQLELDNGDGLVHLRDEPQGLVIV